MATALTGSLGWTGLHPVQLGGPPLISTWSRPLPSAALPLLAHAYATDGAALGTFGILNRPTIKATLANGGYEQITLDVAGGSSGALYGLTVYGAGTYGGSSINLALGNVIRLTELGGPFKGFVYSGIIESFPDVRSQSGTSHQIVLTPFGAELTRVATQLVYTTAVDIAQAVRDAVALTQHCSCDQASVPAATGFPLVSTSGAAVDFRGQKVNQVLDTCRSIAGPTWFWHVDELGRVWFQPQGSGAVYTLYAGQHYEERVSNGGSISDRINQVPAVGGVPVGGSANVQAVVNGASQATIGIRTLDPPIQAPGITDQVTLTAIATGILGTLDQTWTRVALKALPAFGQRVHASQPGGAMLRYWEPARNPLPESAAGAGYMGPFIGQTVEYDGLHQQIEAGSIPVTSQTDIDNMVQRWAQRTAANALQVTAAALNLQQTLTGSFQSSPGALVGGLPAALWSLNQAEFSVADPSAVVRAEMGNLPANGISPAQWGLRANRADGTPIFDSLGVVGIPTLLAEVIQTSAVQGTNTSFADVSGLVTPTFTLSRQSTVVVFAMGRVACLPANTNFIALLGLRAGPNTTSGAPGEVDAATASVMFVPYCLFFRTVLAAGSYTAALQANAQGGGGAQWNVAYGAIDVWLFGG